MITGTITFEDFVAAQRLHRRRPVRLQMILCSVLALLGAGLLMLGHRYPGVVLLGIGGGGWAGEAVMSFVYLPWKYRRLYRQQASLRAAYTYAWDADNLRVSSAAGQAARPWKHYLRMREDERMFLLYHSDMMFEMLPKSWFRDSELVDAFHRQVTRHGL